MKGYWFYHRTRVEFGEGALEKVGDIHKLGRKVLVVTGRRWARGSGVLDRAKGLLERAGVKSVEFSEVEENPSTDTVDQVARLCTAERIEAVLAIGGGSALDVGKAAALVATSGGKCRDYFGQAKEVRPPLPVVAVPTTSGSGSEVTRYAVLVDSHRKMKDTISSFGIAPELALCDPALTVSMSPHLTASTGLDALCHAVEGYISLLRSPASDFLAVEAISTVRDTLPRVVREGDNLELRLEMMRAAMLGGMVVNHTGTIAAHGIGYALTLAKDLQHGEASAVVLPYVLAKLYPSDSSRVERVSHLMGGSDIVEVMRDFNRSVGIAGSLDEAGIRDSELDMLARMGMENSVRALKRMSAELSLEDFRAILKHAYSG